jgi:uncharacterized alpha-E superfamily protein
VKHGANGLISRVADSCFWFGRYLERSEAVARQLQATLGLALDGELPPRRCWAPVVVVAGEESSFRVHVGDHALGDGEAVQRYLVWDEACAVSLARTAAAARENARSIRDVLSGDAWEIVNQLHLWLGETGRAEFERHRDGFYAHVRSATQLSLGLLRSTMLHDTVLDFIWLGVLLERVGQTARLLDVHHHAFGGAGRAHQVVETAVWVALLGACSGVEPFMRAHAGHVTPEAVARFLCAEARFPRSVAYCVRSAHERLLSICPRSLGELPGARGVQRLGQLTEWVDERAGAVHAASLHAVLTHVVDETAAICETIGVELLGYGGPAPEATPAEA